MKAKFYLSFLTLISLFISNQSAYAQTYQPSNRAPVADNTLGTQVSGSGNNFNITGGLNKGQTLFHSFTDFSVPTNGSANFTNPVGNRDIITRVTGNVFSDINGLVNTNGANFFLINPNGIVFGTGAQLNVGKAFVGSTANSIDLVGGGSTINFGTNPNGDAPLLSVAPNVLFDVSRLNMGGGTGSISNFGTLQTTNNSQYIGLIGGNVTLDGGKIFAPGGRVDIGGLNSAGSVTIDNNGLVFSGTGLKRSDVLLTNDAAISVRVTGTLAPVNTVFDNTIAAGSSINISADRLDILNSGALTSGTLPAALDAGLGTNSGVQTISTGDIKIDTTGKVTLNNSNIKNTLRSGAEGRIGGIKIQAGAVDLNNSLISTALAGRGSVGDITIASSGDVNLTDRSGISSDNIQGNGDAGNIDIKSVSNFNVTDHSYISSDNIRGTGKAGDLKIGVSGNLNIIEYSYISSDNVEGSGNAGNIDLQTIGNINVVGTNNISLLDKPRPAASYVSTKTSGKGDTGKIVLNAQGDISFSNNSLLASVINENGEGNSQGIEIKNARDLKLNNSSLILTDNLGGVGNAGNIDIKNIRNLTVANQSSISSGINNENSRGNGGNINIQTTGNIDIIGFDSQTILISANSSAIASIRSDTSGRGNAGNISIDTTGDIKIANQGFISTSIVPGADGKSGAIEIKNARNLNISNNSFLASANLGGNGDAGKITIDIIGDITIADLSYILTSLEPKAQGNAGGIEIKNARNLKLVNGSSIASTSSGKGDAGNIDIKTRGKIEILSIDPQSQLSQDDPSAVGSPERSFVSAASGGEGKAANISISTYRLDLQDRGYIGSSGAAVSGGDITLAVSDVLLLRNGSFIFTNSLSPQPDSNGGNIAINSPLIVSLSPNLNTLNIISADAVGGNGGRVNITSQGLFGFQYVPKERLQSASFRAQQISSFFNGFITSSSEFGQQGAVTVDTPGTDPGRDTTELPNTTSDASNQISQVCGASNRQNKLTVAGRGGLPPTANDPLTSDVVWQDTRATSSQPVAISATPQLAPPAVGWVFDGKGKVTLVAATAAKQTGTSVVCPQVLK